MIVGFGSLKYNMENIECRRKNEICLFSFCWNVDSLEVPHASIFLQVIKVDHEAHGVDAPEDVEKIESLMREKNLF